MLYLVGLGLEKKGISLEGKEVVGSVDKVYLESYTVDFPYSNEELEEVLERDLESLDRNEVESDKLVEEAENKDIVLLVYGSPLMATTHISLVIECRKKGVDCRILENGSIFDAVSETGLQAYKFGKTTSMPNWEEKGKSKGFIEVIKNNLEIDAHTLILVDIGLPLEKALKQLKKASNKKINLDSLVVCSCLGTKNSKFYYDKIDNLKNVKKPFCLIIPGKLHFTEKEALESLKEKN